MAKVETIRDVVEYQLCTGCGVCAYLDSGRLQMVDHVAVGRRPVPLDGDGAGNRACLDACPGRSLVRGTPPDGADASLWDEWGSVLGVWEGYAGDPEIRFAGSSGGVASALALFCIEREGMEGVLHTAARDDAPHLNRSVVSRSRAEILARTGSRYAPASPCEELGQIEHAEGRSVFIGKPCDVAALQMACVKRPDLGAKVGAAIAFFCAGTPSTQGTLDLLRQVGVAQAGDVRSLRYRGNGWPGMWSVEAATGGQPDFARQLTYKDSWHFLQRYRQWRCYICPDHTGEFADVAVGDPWYRPVEPGEHGKSLIVARTARGLALVRAAHAAGYLVLEREDGALLPRSQPNIRGTTAALWGRLLALRLTGAAAPAFIGFPLLPLWLRSPFIAKLGSLTGTIKRVFTRRLNQRLRMKSAPHGARVE